jgi:hypothetical protein
MKKIVLPLAVLAMIALLAAAFAWDCVSLAANGRRRVASADEEMHKHERRLVQLVKGSPRLSPDVQAAIAAHETADTSAARHDAYERLVASFRLSMSGGVDPTNPLDRKFADDVAGAINRREIAQKPYDEELDAYRAFLAGFRGRVARWFSAAARADWQRDT